MILWYMLSWWPEYCCFSVWWCAMSVCCTVTSAPSVEQSSHMCVLHTELWRLTHVVCTLCHHNIEGCPRVIRLLRAPSVMTDCLVVIPCQASFLGRHSAASPATHRPPTTVRLDLFQTRHRNELSWNGMNRQFVYLTLSVQCS